MNLFLLTVSTLLLAATGVFAELDLAKILKLQSELPKCSVQCIRDTVVKHGCAVVDLNCQCTNMQPIIQDVAPCFVKAGCGLDDIANSAQTVFKICETVAAASTENITAIVEPAEPTQSIEIQTGDASALRRAASGTIVSAGLVVGLLMA
ncbi:CFEM domain-containing protein [Sarocladium implicatum]|nr:CFEM domain-containing protein [Sarocladium implicatum]